MYLSVQLIKQRPWLFALFLSLGVHAGLLSLLGEQGLSRMALTASRTGSRALQLRVLPHTIEQKSQPSDGKLLTTAIEELTPSLPLPADSPPSVTEDVTASVEPQPANNTSAPSLSIAESHYYAAKDLTTKPQFLSEGNAPAPTVLPDIYPLPVVVHLYLDETGAVDAVVLDESFLSETAKKFITDTFSAMKFTPGMLGSFPVKSQLLLEARLDSILQKN